MVDIDFKQYKMLSYIKHHKTIKGINFTEEQLDICSYLKSKGFITARTVVSHTPHYSVYRITQEGRAQLSSYVLSFHKWWIPLAVSIVALIFSIIK